MADGNVQDKVPALTEDQVELDAELKLLQIELSSACRGKCRMCPNPGMTKKRKHMSIPLLDKILEEVAQMDTLIDPMAYCGLGEPLMNPRAVEAFELTASHDIPWALGTNCEKLNHEVAEALVKYKPEKLVLSVDAMTAETMAKVRPGLDADCVFENVHHVLDMIRQDPWGCEVWVQMINFPVNTHEVVDFLKHYEELLRDIPNSVLYVKQACSMPGAEGGPDMFPSPLVEIPEELKPRDSGPKIMVDDFATPWRTYDPENEGPPCGLAWQYLMIRADGSVIPCCMDVNDQLVVGDMNYQTLDEIFHSDTIQTLRRQFLEHRLDELPLCHACLTATAL